MAFEAETKVRMPKKTYDALSKRAKAQAERTGGRVTVSDVIREAIFDYLQAGKKVVAEKKDVL